MLTKHLLNIRRGLFLEFIFSSPQVPMLSLLVHFRGAFNSVQLCILETYIKNKISYMSCDKTLFIQHEKQVQTLKDQTTYLLIGTYSCKVVLKCTQDGCLQPKVAFCVSSNCDDKKSKFLCHWSLWIFQSSNFFQSRQKINISKLFVTTLRITLLPNPQNGNAIYLINSLQHICFLSI